MSGLKRIVGSFNVLNLILSAVLLLFILFLFLPEVRKGARYTLPDIKRTPVPSSEEAESRPADKSPSPTDYMIVAEKNVFHPERKIPVEKKAEAPLPKPDFILYGTLVTDEAAIAYMEDAKAPVSTPGRGRRQVAVALGDTLSGFTLKKIDADRVTMVRGEETMVVRLDEPGKTKKRAETASVTADTGQPATERTRAQTAAKVASQQRAQEAVSSVVQQPPADQAPTAASQTSSPPAQPGRMTFGGARTLRPGR